MGNQSQINTYSSVVKDRLISVHVHVGRSLERLGYRRASYVNLHRRASVRDSARAVCSSVVCLLHAVHRCTVILDRRKPHRLGGTLHRKKKYGSTSGRTFEGAVSWYWSIVHYRPRLFHLFFQEHVESFASFRGLEDGFRTPKDHLKRKSLRGPKTAF